MSTRAGAAGTASGPYRAAPVACAFEATVVEPGERPRCRTCGCEKATHLPKPRGTR